MIFYMIHHFALSSKNTSLAFIDQILFYKEQDQKDQIHLVQRCEQIKQSKKHSFHSYLVYPKLEELGVRGVVRLGYILAVLAFSPPI